MRLRRKGSPVFLALALLGVLAFVFWGVTFGYIDRFNQYSNLVVAIFAVIAAPMALWQLIQVKTTTDVSFMQTFDLILQQGSQARRAIYNNVPRPDLPTTETWHEDWLKTTKEGSDLYGQIEGELKRFDRMGLFLRKAHMDREIFLSLWFDVIARLCVLLCKFVAKETKSKGPGYLLNFRFLARENLQYVKDKHKLDRILIQQVSTPMLPWQTNDSSEINIDALESAVSVMSSVETPRLGRFSRFRKRLTR